MRATHQMSCESLSCPLAGWDPGGTIPVCKAGKHGQLLRTEVPGSRPSATGKATASWDSRGGQPHLHGRHLLLVRDKTVVLPYLLLISYNIHAQTLGPSSGTLPHSVNSAPGAGAARRSRQRAAQCVSSASRPARQCPPAPPKRPPAPAWPACPCPPSAEQNTAPSSQTLPGTAGPGPAPLWHLHRTPSRLDPTCPPGAKARAAGRLVSPEAITNSAKMQRQVWPERTAGSETGCVHELSREEGAVG